VYLAMSPIADRRSCSAMSLAAESDYSCRSQNGGADEQGAFPSYTIFTVALVSKPQAQIKTGWQDCRPVAELNPGDDLFSHKVDPLQYHGPPPELVGLPSSFGMGTGVTPPV
jgi:hypothetical protein